MDSHVSGNTRGYGSICRFEARGPALQRGWTPEDAVCLSVESGVGRPVRWNWSRGSSGAGALRLGRFITFEGIEGSGKSLQLDLIATELARRGLPVRVTLEPGGTRFGREIREILLRAEGADREPVAELLLYLADRFQHLKEVVEPALADNLIVLSDRYHDATLAYQGYARQLGLEFIDGLTQQLSLISPDLTLVFDVDVVTGLSRARARNRLTQSEAQGRFEEESLEFHERVRDGYLLLARNFPERIRVVEAAGTPEEVFERTWVIVANELGIGP